MRRGRGLGVGLGFAPMAEPYGACYGYCLRQYAFATAAMFSAPMARASIRRRFFVWMRLGAALSFGAHRRFKTENAPKGGILFRIRTCIKICYVNV